MQGEWIRKPKGKASVVFVHGILSSGEACWRNEKGVRWPELLKNEEALDALGIYVYTYQTSIFSGDYRVSDVVDDLKERLRLDEVIDNERIIFVCHSLGGIVVRKFLVERAVDLIERRIVIGLFLVASPSLGTQYADWLSPLAQLFEHSQADALRFVRNNTWLSDLDKEFQNLKEAGKLRIVGKELIEDKFIVFKRFMMTQVVERFAGARYFGEQYKVPGSDHHSIAKPVGKDAIQHKLLCQFIKEVSAGMKGAREEERKVADEALTFLHNEGLFYAPYHYEEPLDCYESADKIRDELVKQSKKVSKDSKVFLSLDQIREHCKMFMRTLKDKSLVVHDGKGLKSAPFEVTSAQMDDFYKLIGRLRMDCHPHIRSLAENYGCRLSGELKKAMDRLEKQSDTEGA
jgi:pimeloyl-ACP methyl ester carboxylesterase